VPSLDKYQPWSPERNYTVSVFSIALSKIMDGGVTLRFSRSIFNVMDVIDYLFSYFVIGTKSDEEAASRANSSTLHFSGGQNAWLYPTMPITSSLFIYRILEPAVCHKCPLLDSFAFRSFVRQPFSFHKLWIH